jgi:hypothetical protein
MFLMVRAANNRERTQFAQKESNFNLLLLLKSAAVEKKTLRFRD